MIRIPALAARMAAPAVAAGTWIALAGPVYLDRLDSPGPQPEGLASDGTHLWVADFQAASISRVDTESGQAVHTYDSPGPHPEGLAWDGTHLWSADWNTRKIYRHQVSDTALTVVREFHSPSTTNPVGLAWDGEMLWLTTWYPQGLYRLDPESGNPVFHRALNTSPVYPGRPPQHPEDLAWDGAALWITDWYTKQVYRIDPETMQVLETVPSGGPKSVGLAFHRGYLWNGDTGNGSNAPALYRLDVQGGIPARAVTWGSLKGRFRAGDARSRPPR